MKTAALTGVLLLGAAAAARADELPLSLGADDTLLAAQDDDAPPGRQDDGASFSIGPAAGYLKARDADRGRWFGGVQARLRFLRILAVEGSVTVHTDSFQDGDIDIIQYPVQVSALLFPIPDSPIEPYGLVGAGWYYTRAEFDGALEGLDDETDRDFGWHVGAGIQVELGPRFALFADFRWIFLDEPGIDNGNLDEEEFDFGQVMLGASFRF